MRNIIYKHETGFSVVYYLLIEGGQGHGNKNLGGTYKFTGGYFNPTQLKGRKGLSLEKWCEDNNLNYEYSDTIEGLMFKLNMIANNQ